MLPQIYLLRHGETEWSLSGQHTSRTDLALTPRGEAQARAAGLFFKGLVFSQVLVSPRQRARQTCELAGLSEKMEIVPDLQEWDYGDYEGLKSNAILAKTPSWNIYRDGCPNGESPAQITARADRLVARLRRTEGKVAVFSHGHFLRVLAVRWILLPLETGQRFGLATASLGILGFSGDDLDKPVINLWNQAPVES